MKVLTVRVSLCVFLCLFGLNGAHAQTTGSFKHIVLIVQENRTPDNLFHGLLTWPGINPANYDIATSGLALVNGKDEVVALTPGPLANDYDLSHAHPSFLIMYDKGKMDRANLIPDTCEKTAIDCTSNGAGQFLSYKYVDNSTHIVDPYLQLAANYGWANQMFQTNQGPSYPAHMFLFGGTSALTAADDAAGTFMSENPGSPTGSDYSATQDTGCLAPSGEFNFLVTAGSTTETKLINTVGTFCVTHETMASLLNGIGVSWKYYAPAVLTNSFPNDPARKGYNSGGSIWNAPASISPICQPDSAFAACAGAEYTSKVDLNPPDVLTDISECKLSGVSWVIPDGRNSDHPSMNQGGGPSWVASIVNAIGENTTCDGKGYWQDTAIIVTWDDWGGWFDHVKPPVLSGPQGDYQMGFRVPLIFISAFTTPAAVSDVRYDFGSVLRFVERNFKLREGELGFADARSDTNLGEFYDFRLGPLPFRPVAAPLKASFFLSQTGPPEPPDTD